MKKLKLAVIGKDVSKSISPQIHSFIAAGMGNQISYEKLSVPEEEFANIAENLFGRYDGFNVTIPFKLTILPYLEKVCGDALAFGAVNTVTAADRHGYNTDGAGFALMLENNGVRTEGKTFLVVGAGGAGRSVAKTLVDGGASVDVYDIHTENSTALEREFAGVRARAEIPSEPYYCIINASGVGMHRTEGISPVDERLISLCEVAADLIYVPEKSRFLEIAEKLGKRIINGEAMLFYQAYYAECIYFGVQPSAAEAKKLFEAFKRIKE